MCQIGHIERSAKQLHACSGQRKSYRLCVLHSRHTLLVVYDKIQSFDYVLRKSFEGPTELLVLPLQWENIVYSAAANLAISASATFKKSAWFHLRKNMHPSTRRRRRLVWLYTERDPPKESAVAKRWYLVLPQYLWLDRAIALWYPTAVSKSLSLILLDQSLDGVLLQYSTTQKSSIGRCQTSKGMW